MTPVPPIAVIFALLAAVSCDQHHQFTSEEKLLDALLHNDRGIFLARPVQNFTQVVPVKITLTLTRIQAYDHDNNYVTVSAWLSLMWNDYRLTWEPKLYDGITQISFPPKNRVWVPDIKLFNGIEPQMETGDVNAVAYNTGDILWIRPVRFIVNCDRLRTQTDEPAKITEGSEIFKSLTADVRCKAVFGPWTYDMEKVEVKNPILDLASKHSINPEFIITDRKTEMQAFMYAEAADEVWHAAVFKFSLMFAGS